MTRYSAASIAAFIVLSLAISWVAAGIILVLLGVDAKTPALLLLLVAKFGPTLAALAQLTGPRLPNVAAVSWPAELALLVPLFLRHAFLAASLAPRRSPPRRDQHDRHVPRANRPQHGFDADGRLDSGRIVLGRRRGRARIHRPATGLDSRSR